MKHEDMRDVLSDYHDGALGGPQKAEFEAHLTACKRCREDLRSIRAAESAIRGYASSPLSVETEELVDAVRIELQAAPELVWLGKSLSSPRWSIPAFTMVIAAVLALSRPPQPSYEPAEALFISLDDGFAYKLLMSGPADLLGLEAR